VQKWVINVILFVILVLGIWSLYAPEKSPVSKRIGIGLLILSFIVAIVNNFHAFVQDPSSQQAGTLKPKYSRSYKTNNKVATSVGMNQTSQLFTVQMDEGVIVQPLGRYAPFSIKRASDGLLISAIIHSLDGKVIAKIQNNEWVLNPNNYFQKNFDKSALEVIDEYDIPILQVEYIDKNRIKIGGIFHLEEREILEIYPDFPSTPKGVNPRAIVSFRGVIIVMGKDGMTTKAPNTTKSQDLRMQAKNLIEPWFDYSKPKKLGIRRKTEVKKQP